ncbi:hypothetical protein MES4922_100107 [Mesorhizobium ventifaucium]|uniref:Uncharacterized protein n=1 Tax=Mesorhizobium ventifaucium TaxID=666020 RepID=A0ABN8JBM6_9HYPH|nr:hypothetical protein MES4922_100107 [Mesorhizobium ventifaucium]
MTWVFAVHRCVLSLERGAGAFLYFPLNSGKLGCRFGKISPRAVLAVPLGSTWGAVGVWWLELEALVDFAIGDGNLSCPVRGTLLHLSPRNNIDPQTSERTFPRRVQGGQRENAG